ncbi:MAG: hypothetical protein QM692_16475 [Thermomicrobiales bacterium]
MTSLRTFDEKVQMLRHARLASRHGLAAALLVGAAFGLAPLASAFQTPADQSPESGTAQVVAQGVLQVGDGDLRWQVTDRVAQLPGNAEPIASDAGFLVVESGVLLLEDTQSGNQYRLPAGEAALTHSEATQQRVALGSDVAEYHDIVLTAADAAVPADETVIYASEPFAGPGSRHDVDLLQDTLAAGGQWSVPAGALPTLVLVDSGIADVATEAGDVVSLGAGEAASFAGQIILTAGADGAVVSAVVVGPAVPQLGQAAQVAATPAAVATATPARPAASPSAEGVIEVETAAEGTPEAAAAPQGAGNDADGDGLSARREEELGTDPSLADTDEDGLTDGAEVQEHKTNPLAADTDGDGVLDGDEVALGTDPTDPNNGTAVETPVAEEAVVEEAPAAEPEASVAEEAADVVAEEPASAGTPGDSDGDGLEDALEFELGTDPYSTDTDLDGLSDGDEYYVTQTGTRNPDTDGDGILDGDEIAQGTDPNVPNG